MRRVVRPRSGCLLDPNLAQEACRNGLDNGTQECVRHVACYELDTKGLDGVHFTGKKRISC